MMKLSGAWARVLGISVLAAILFPGTARAAVDAFLKIDGVKGESSDDKHKDWLVIQSFQWDALQERAEAERMGRQVNREQPLVITRDLDVASPTLMEACASGKHFAELDIDVVSGGKTQHYHLMNVTVSSYIRKAGGKPLEQISFTYQKITVN